LLGREALACLNLCNGPIDVGEALGREEVVEVLGIFQVMLQHIGNVFVSPKLKQPARTGGLSRARR